MQQAVQELMEDLDPDFIEQEASGSKKSLLGSNKSKLWEAYVTRWKAKAGNYENGMLDVFLMLFAEYYDKHSRQGR
jgi:type VI secretion system protein ImpI